MRAKRGATLRPFTDAIVECNLPTKNLTHTYTLEATSVGTRVTEVMRYDTKFGPFGRLLDRLVLRPTTEKGINGFLAGLAMTVTDEARMA